MRNIKPLELLLDYAALGIDEYCDDTEVKEVLTYYIEMIYELLDSFTELGEELDFLKDKALEREEIEREDEEPDSWIVPPMFWYQ